MPDSEQKTRDAVLATPTPVGDPAWDETASTETSSEATKLPLSHELNQSLARLERNSLEVKHYLDAIEEKISRIEPRLEQMREAQPTASALSSAISEEPPADSAPPIPVPTESTTDRRRRRLDIPPPGSAFADRPGLPVSVPSGVAGISEEVAWALKPWLLGHRRQLAIAGAILLIFVTVLTFGSGNHAKSPASSATGANTPAVTSPGLSPPTGSVPIPKSSAGTPAATASGTEPYSRSFPDPGRTETVSEAAAASSSSGTAPSSSTIWPSGIPATSRLDTSASPAPTSVSPTPTSASNTTKEPGPTTSTRLIPASGRVRVSSGVMAGNLLFSPTPKYPGGFASLFHTEGKVTMQAIIARNGHVENLRVLSGHHLLRGAAQDAVRTWRYRPYSINGVSVEVATIVTVEFHR